MTAPLPICVLKNGSRVRRTKLDRASTRRGRLPPAPIMISGRLAARIISAARSRAAGCATGRSIGCTGTIGASAGSISSAATSSGSSRCTGPGRSSMATRKASRTTVGIERRADDLPRQLGQRLHRGDHVDDLEPGLAGGPDRLLAGDHDHRHGAEMGVGRSRREVQRARPEGRDADARLAGEPAVGGGHEGGRLLVAGQHQLDRGGAQRLDHVEVLLARDAEDALDALVLERRDQEIRTFGHGRQLSS